MAIVIDVALPTGDPITDTANINAAIQEAHRAYVAAGSTQQVEVRLGAGTYIVQGDPTNPSQGAVELRSGVALIGQGMAHESGGTSIKLVDGFNARINGIVRTDLESVDNVKIAELTIDGNRANNIDHQAGFICGIKEDGSGRTQSNITLSGVEIKNCTAYGFNPHEVTTNVTIENCIAHGNGLDGFVADYIVGGVYRNNTAWGNDRHGFNIQNASADLLLENNHSFSNGSSGLTIQRGNIAPAGETVIPWVTNIDVIGGSYYNNAREGILVKLSDEVSITGVEVYANRMQGIRIEGSTGTIVQNSRIYNNSQAADNTYDEVQIRMRIDEVTDQTFYATGTQVLNNQIFSNGAINARYGVREEPTNDDGGPTGTVVSDNAISGMDSGPISIPPSSTRDDPVVAVDDAYTVKANSAFTATAAQSLLANDQIPDGGGTALSGQYATAHGGVVTINADGTFTYTPKSGFVGVDSFTYTARDGDGDTDVGAVALEVRPANSIAIGVTQVETLILDGFSIVSIKAAAGGTAVENRNKDVEARAKGAFIGEAGTYQLTLSYFDENDGASPMGIRVNGVTAATWVANKQLGSSGSDAKTLVSYSVALNLKKDDIIEIYGIRKDAELVRVDQLTIEAIGSAAPADSPVTAEDDSYSVVEREPLSVSAIAGVLANDLAPDGGIAAIAGTIISEHGGTVVLAADGSFSYTAAAGFWGEDRFTYSARDVDGDSDTGVVILNVQDVDAPPPDNPAVANDDRYSATEDTVLSVSAASGVLANDTAPDGGKSAVAGTITTTSGGTVSLAADGSFTYNPLKDFFGTDSFDYLAFDADGDRDTGTVVLNVADVPETGPTPYPAISAGRTQLETLTLDGFTFLALKTADGGQAIESRTKDAEATATGSFTGQSGTYRATLWYYDENDGSSLLGIRVNGQTAASWLADEQLGSAVADAMTRTSYTMELQLTHGDTVEIYGMRDGNDLVRVDYLALDWLLV